MSECSKQAQSEKTMGRSMLTVSSLTFCSRIFGLLRDIAMGWYWGASDVAQAAYQVAFAFPNSLRALFGEGAFNQAFVPIIADSLENRGEEETWRLAERAISLQLSLLLLFVIAISAASLIGLALLPTDTPLRLRLTLTILPVLMPYALFICLSGAFSAVLNCLRRFFLPALNPIIYNLVQICSILLLALLWRNDEFMALLFFCLSALLAGLLQLLMLMLAARRHGFVYHFNQHWNCPEVKLLCRNVLPGLVGAGVMQINSLIDRILGLYLGSAAVGALNYSQHLVYLPVGIFGVAMGVVCLPNMSRAWGRQDENEMNSSLNYAMRMILFLSLPCAFLLWTLSQETVSLLFYRGAFTLEAVRQCAWTLNFYVLGLPAFCLAKVATNPFHARKDTRTPVRIALFCMCLNLILNLILMQFLRQGGLALSTSICSWMNVILLLKLNRKHQLSWQPNQVLKAMLSLTLMAALAGSLAWLLRNFLQTLTFFGAKPQTALHDLLVLIIAGGSAALSYLILNKIAGRPELKELVQALSAK
ncbi:MAG: murein biosynthesis integral membrane protein MurJ [Oligosphaeraceae bacterium]|nr:murein biosynthesis integral membrane protein MurJ [Oligosphaeraceae bacterium]